ncbi:MFS transporter [Nocardia vinacea]|uniref:MFS transporter n=1 Tax=Nocardia vinacea TaxID=96468 RepID=A0ABZ1YR80_9NOCA|nr:MFS transporter [Nocardia vinacea]
MATTTSATPHPEQAHPVDMGRLDGASTGRVIAVLAAIVLLTETSAFQTVMVGAALQKMTTTFSSVGSDINWAIIITGIVGAAATPLLGKLSDIWGKKRIYVVCGLAFVTGSVIAALTSSWTLFLVGRGLQAFSAATLVLSYGLIRDLLPRKYVTLGLGIVAGGVGASGLLGPIIAGALVDHYQWRAMFWFLAIYGAVVLVLFALVVPESKLRTRERFRPAGVIVLSMSVSAILLYLSKGQDWGWSRPSALAWVVGGVAGLVLFVLIESRSSRPVIDLKVLANPQVSLTMVMALFASGMLMVVATALGYMSQTPSASQLKEMVAQGAVDKAREMTGMNLPLSMVNVTLDPEYRYGSGFGMLEFATHLGIWAGVVSMIFGPLAGILARRIGVRIPVIFSCVVMISVGIGFALATPHYSWQLFAVLSAVFGIGFGLFFAGVSILMVDALPEEQQGIGSGMLGVAIGIGTAFGSAIMAAFQSANPVNASVSVMGQGATQPIPQIFGDDGYVLTFWTMSGLALIALIVAIVMRHGRKPSTAGASMH